VQFISTVMGTDLLGSSVFIILTCWYCGIVRFWYLPSKNKNFGFNLSYLNAPFCQSYIRGL